MTSCSRKLLVVTNTFAVVLGLAIIAFGVYITFDETQTGFLSLIPQVMIYSMFGVGSVIFLVGGLGLFGICARSKCFMYFYIFFTTMTFFLTALLTPYLLLYANDIATIDGLDSLVSDATSDFVTLTVNFAIDEPTQWADTQNLLQCCGITVDAMFFDYSTVDGTLDDVLTGDKCQEADAIAALTEFRQTYVSNSTSPEVPDAATAFVENNEVLKDDFFCGEAFADVLKSFTIPIGVTGGVLAILQLLNIRAAFVLLYRIVYENGGFVEGYGDDVGSYKPGAQNYGRKQSRLGPLQSEMPRAPTAFARGRVEGEKPGSDRFINRLSYRIKQSLDNDFFNPPKAPAGGAGQPNVREDISKFGKRVSSRFRQVGDDTRSFGNRMSSRFRGPSSDGGSSRGLGQRLSSRFGWGSPPEPERNQSRGGGGWDAPPPSRGRGGWGGPDV